MVKIIKIFFVVLIALQVFFNCLNISADEPRIEWTSTYNSPSNGADQGVGIAVDSSGNVYITGSEFRSDLLQYENILVRKYNNNGLVLWTTTYNSPSNDFDWGMGIAVDAGGNVYVTGSERRADLGQAYNMLVRKYDTNGIVLWTTTYNSPANGDDQGNGISVDSSGNVYVSGTSVETSGGANIWVRKYDTNGLIQWTTTYNGPANSGDFGFGISVDGSGNVYVSGTSDETSGGTNIWVRKYDTNGLIRWTTTYNNPANVGDHGYGIAVDAGGNVYVTGYEWRPDLGQSTNVWVRKYVQDILTDVPKVTVTAPVVPEEPKEISANLKSGEVKVEIPANTFSETVNVTVTELTTLPPVASRQTELKATNVAVEIKNDKNLQPQAEITITMNYRDSDISGLDESKLSICYYDQPYSKWVTLPSAVYPDLNKVTGRIKHLSIFRVFQLAPSSDLAGVIVYPNPYKPGASGASAQFADPALGAGVVFGGLTQKAGIRIYNAAAKLVFEADETDGDGMFLWDTKNKDGEKVASGVYIYYITNPDNPGMKPAKGKFSIIR